MTKKLFKTLSYILHPIFMPVVGILLILTFSHLAMLPVASKKAILSLVGIVTVIFPLSILPILYYQKKISGVTMPSRRERLIPLFLTSVSYYFGYFLLNKYSAPLFLQKYMLAVFASVLLASIISIKWKISLHMIGIGGLMGLISALSHLFNMHNSFMFMTAILAAGVIGTGRLYLKEHDSTQVYAGFLMGYVLNFVIIVFFKL